MGSTLVRLLTLALLSASAFADDPVCIRNYKGLNASACESFPGSYTGVYAKIAALTPACARIYAPFYCETDPKDYTEITAVDGSQICVMNYNQPPVANLCETLPQFYIYVERQAP
ncbi:hypothetical protein K2X33_11600 [bacterium]|nr:hypothetical protein [bacterium]